MKDNQSKREREKRLISEMISLYCRKMHRPERQALSCVRCAQHLCTRSQRPMSLYGAKDLLLQLQGALLQAGYAGANPRRHALVRAENAVSSSDNRIKTRDREQEREGENNEEEMPVKKTILITIGCLCLGLGAVGVVLPVLPTTPFLLVTAYCFARSSERLSRWFRGTKLYRNHLESFMKKEGMRVSTKAGIIASVTVLMGIGFFLMARKEIWIPCGILAVVWLAHIIYFGFFVKTLRAQ